MKSLMKLIFMNVGCAELHSVPAVPRLAAADGGGRTGGLAALHTQGSRLQGGEGQPNIQVHITYPPGRAQPYARYLLYSALLLLEAVMRVRII